MANISVATNHLIDAVAERLTTNSPTRGRPNYATLGIGSQTPSTGSTSVTTPVPITYTDVDDCDSTTGWSASTDGSVALNTTDGEYIEGTGCLNLVKSGTTATAVTFNKTTTSVDFTSKTLWTWVYFTALTDLATTNCVEVRFGSDSSNYYYRRWNKSDLTTGPNNLTMTTATATGTTGSPVVTACDYYAIIITVDATSKTYTGNSVRLDHLLVATTSDTQKTYYSGPTHSPAADTVTNVLRIGLQEAVGKPLTNVGWFLDTGEMYGIDQYNTDTKTQEEEMEYTDAIQFVPLP